MADGITKEELRIKIGVMKAAIKAALDTNPYEPIAIESSEEELHEVVNNLQAAYDKL
jgi:hypothetical protein